MVQVSAALAPANEMPARNPGVRQSVNWVLSFIDHHPFPVSYKSLFL
jgi:hypothetical protein